MRLRIGRVLRGHDMAIGLLYIDRRPECLLEMLGTAAIVSGRYRVGIGPNARFGRPLPMLVDAHGFERLHIVPGEVLTDWASGCLVPALEGADGGLLRTRQAYDSVYAQIQAALALGEDVKATIL